MARPYKSGLDYFSFDVDFFEDEKITAISVEFGIKGEVIAIRLLCAIYRNGYYAKWDVPLKMKIAKSSGLAPDLIDQVVDRLVKWGFFDQDLFNSSAILTSKGIQRRYLKSTKRRLESAIRDYCLLNVNNNSINVSSNQQSKVKERERKTPSLSVSLSPPEIQQLQEIFGSDTDFDFYFKKFYKPDLKDPLTYIKKCLNNEPKPLRQKTNGKIYVRPTLPRDEDCASPEEFRRIIAEAKSNLKNGG